jgi:16S rRNA (cytosine1402-N4)-methyltransferase
MPSAVSFERATVQSDLGDARSNVTYRISVVHHHQPVLLEEMIAALQPGPGKRFIDGTFGGGGHSLSLLDASRPNGTVLAIDRDPEAIARGEALIQRAHLANRLQLHRGTFADMAAIAREAGLANVDGILLDLGLSSYQLDDPGRGFAFRFEGPLDMRFDPDQATDAATLVNQLPEAELSRIIWTYGEESQARRIARAIVRERAMHLIETTSQLADLVERTVGGRRGARTHPATKTFQALRIATNEELQALEDALRQALDLLAVDGRLAVISFHSLEDRIVKQFIARESATCVCPPEQPICTCNQMPRLRAAGRKQRATQEEIDRNPRSRSAILRVAERVGDGT